jgi:hypothetical protein
MGTFGSGQWTWRPSRTGACGGTRCRQPRRSSGRRWSAAAGPSSASIGRAGGPASCFRRRYKDLGSWESDKSARDEYKTIWTHAHSQVLTVQTSVAKIVHNFHCKDLTNLILKIRHGQTFSKISTEFILHEMYKASLESSIFTVGYHQSNVNSPNHTLFDQTNHI